MVVRYVEYPLVGGYGDIASYNYDRIQDKKITLTDALVKKETTLDDVRQMVIDSCLRMKKLSDKETSIYGVTVDGFSLDANDNCTFLWKCRSVSERNDAVVIHLQLPV